jgi:hypothetical protein
MVVEVDSVDEGAGAGRSRDEDPVVTNTKVL